MAQLDNMKTFLGITDTSEDTILQLELDNAALFIATRRNTWDLTDPDNPVATVEPRYLGVQVQLAIESYSKRGVEGEESHSEAGVRRGYDNGGPYSQGTMNLIIPKVRVIYDATEDTEA